jgi:hypothetical protein
MDLFVINGWSRYQLPCIVDHFFLFNLKVHNTLNTYICHQLPPIYFVVCYTIFSETIALLAQKLYAACNVVSSCAIKCTIYVYSVFIYIL